MIALLSTDTIHLYKDEKGVVPAELKGRKIIEWTWPGIAAFINSV